MESSLLTSCLYVLFKCFAVKMHYFCSLRKSRELIEADSFRQ